MKVTFYGVRGSIASPHKNTLKYGGNTSCLLVESDQDDFLILDAGTGIKKLGEQLVCGDKPKKNINILFSHFHWDHIQGFPSFAPIYQTGSRICLISGEFENSHDHPVLNQFTAPYFPISSKQLNADIDYKVIDENTVLHIGDMEITSTLLNHIGGGLAYRIDTPQGSIAYVTDNELFPPDTVVTDYQTWQDFLQGVDLLIHDATYLDYELERTHGWGHSLVSQALQLAYDANVGGVVLFHYESNRTDEQLGVIKKESITWMKKQNSACQVFVAKEGDCYEVLDSTMQLVRHTAFR